MSKQMKFVGVAPVAALERIYRDAYNGHEADVRFRPMEENFIRLDIVVDVPHMISRNEKWKARFEKVASRALCEMIRECSMIAMEIQNELEPRS